MTRFATFAVLYMTAIFLELSEKWIYPRFTLGILLLLLFILAIGITRITFLIFLAVTTSQFLLVQFPDVPNHVNIEIYCNLVLMLGIIYSLVRSRDFPTDDEYFGRMRPVLQVTAILVYSLAGFHKLNADFFNPEVSCVGDLMGRLYRVVRSDIAGIPASLALAAVVVPVAHRVCSARAVRRYLPAVIGIGAIGAMVAAVLLVRTPAAEIPPLAKSGAIVAMAGGVILWELVGGLLLAFPRLQGPLVAFSLTMHSAFALIGFVDFGALALALLFTFVPGPYLDLLNQRLRLPGLARSVHRGHLYVAITVFAGLISRYHKWTAAGVLFLVAELVLIWPVLSALTAPAPGPVWNGVSPWSRMTPKWMFIFPPLLLLHGLTPYFGLRTTGNFSMFSNLRTEGARSNHLLLGSNPLKFWDYQEDAVRLIAIDDRRAKIGYAYEPLQGNRLPVVEFRKLIYKWTKAGRRIPLTVEYRGKVYSTVDIVNDPVWRTDARNWEMALLDFRPIPPDGPNPCRW